MDSGNWRSLPFSLQRICDDLVSLPWPFEGSIQYPPFFCLTLPPFHVWFSFLPPVLLHFYCLLHFKNLSCISLPLLPSWYIFCLPWENSPFVGNGSVGWFTAPVPTLSFLYYILFYTFSSLLPWRLKVPPKYWYLALKLYRVTSKKTIHLTDDLCSWLGKH